MFMAWPDRVSTTKKNRIRGPLVLFLGLIMAAGMVALVVGPRGHFGRLMAEHWRAKLNQVPDDRLPVLLDGVAELGEPGIPVLVEAFGSQRESVAREGKQRLLEEVSRWELLSSPEASRRLAILAESLADQIDQFGPTAKSDAAELATRILLWPLDDKSVDRGRVAQWCDRILRVSAPERRTLDEHHRSGGVTRLLVGGDPAETYPANLEQSMVAAETKPESLSPREFPTIMQLRGDDSDNATRLRVANVPRDEPRKQIGVKVPPMQRLAQLFSVGGDNTQETRASSSVAETGTLDPKAPGRQEETDDRLAEPDNIVNSLRRANTITVMKQLRSADQRIATAAEVELTQRGFSGAHLELARRLFHPDPTVRKRIGRAALETPGINPVPWLVELSRDDDPEVRLTAVTLMATTGEPTLISNIEEIARRDPSERVRRQAQRIAEHRRQTMY
jgi:HEAT repeat protein